MIETRTVFIVGAGASAPYGLPTGGGLRKEIINSHQTRRLMRATGITTWTEFNQPTIGGLVAVDLTREQALSDLQAALRKTGPFVTIDALLDQRESFHTVGMEAIAAALLPLEAHAEVVESDSKTDMDWLGFLFAKMRVPPERFADNPHSFSANKVSFVTFNYDRLIEHRLTGAVAAQYDLPLGQAWEVVRQIPIKHIYGQLGDYAPTPEHEGIAVEYFGEDHDRNRARVVAAAKGIKLIHDRTRNVEVVQQARSLIQNASRVFLLGFGYDSVNLGRLGTERFVADRPAPHVVGTIYGMRGGEVRRARGKIKELFPYVNHTAISEADRYAPLTDKELHLESPSDDALATLREWDDLLD